MQSKGEVENSFGKRIKQEPVDDLAYEYSWNSSSGEQNFICKREPLKGNDAACLRQDCTGESRQITDPAADSWLQNIVKKEPPPSPAAQDTKWPYGSASQTLLSLLEKGRDASTLTCRNIVSKSALTLPGKETNASGMTLATLLTRAQKFTPAAQTSGTVAVHAKGFGSSYLAGGTPELASSPDVSESGHGDVRGLTRLRRLLQGEDITVPPLEPFKKKCEDLETARIALKQFIARHSTPDDTGCHGEYTPGNFVKGLHLKCIFCDYTRTIQEDNTFILHVFAHASNGELDQYNSICPRCTVADLPSNEFVCHALSHCIVTVVGPKS